MAWFYRQYAKELSDGDATAYEQVEARARRERRGLWADASPIEPWSFRRGGATKRPTLAVGGHVIGNRNSKIYHLPNCPDYNKVSERNRVPFATESEAQAAGYRKARNYPQ
jgi:hypothetical protein